MTSPIAILRGPSAGRGRHGGAVDAALKVLRGAGEIRVLEATTADGAVDACRLAVADGARALVAVGGDGTVHLALQAVAGTTVPFGIIPAGTGNDFATEMGVPASLTAAATRVTEALATGSSRSADLARMTGPDGYQRWFGAVLGAGLDAIVNERANAMRWPKGQLRYDLAIYIELVRLRPRRYVITLDGQSREVDSVLVAVANTGSYGGGMRICPDASATDGLLDVFVATPMPRRHVAMLKNKIRAGTHVVDPRTSIARARTVRLECEDIVAYADGERTCPLPVTITAEPAALTLLSGP